MASVQQLRGSVCEYSAEFIDLRFWRCLWLSRESNYESAATALLRARTFHPATDLARSLQAPRSDARIRPTPRARTPAAKIAAPVYTRPMSREGRVTLGEAAERKNPNGMRMAAKGAPSRAIH